MLLVTGFTGRRLHYLRISSQNFPKALKYWGVGVGGYQIELDFLVEISIGKTKARTINNDFFILIRQEECPLNSSFYFSCLAMKNKENESTVSL